MPLVRSPRPACRSPRRTSLRPLLLGLLAATLVAPGLRAQSCVLTRLDSPVLHAFDPSFDAAAAEQKWQFSVGWRYGRSDRHFVGTDEQEERQREGSEVINSVHLMDVELRYHFDRQNSLSVGVPYLMATRTGPVRNAGVLVDRETRSNTRGIGDLAVTFHRLLRDPSAGARANLSLGLGLELPTGENAQTGTRTRYVDGVRQVTVEVADQSVQPGDGGFGVILQASGYALLNAAGTLAGYGSATYVLAPEDESGVPTFRGAAGEQVMSIADQYVARLGLQLGPASWNGLSVALGGRLEGIPVHDLVGSSNGFRRPGYILSVEPSLSWVRGAHSVSLAMPWALERNRQRSVPDIRRGAHGDASFPDYLVILGYSHRF